MNFTRLKEIRQQVYESMPRGADALFNLSDALLSESQAHSLPELSLSAFFQRNWLLSIFADIPFTVNGTTPSSLNNHDHLIGGCPLRAQPTLAASLKPARQRCAANGAPAQPVLVQLAAVQEWRE